MAISKRSTVRGRAIAARRKVREYAMVARALASTSHPVLAQIIPTRFCNLSCAYCNEYDKVIRAGAAGRRCCGGLTTWDGWGRR